MAEIDDLLKQVDDEKLRKRIERAAVKLRNNKTFGLVYESHIPETVALHGLPLRTGMAVQLRGAQSPAAIYRVIASKGDEVEIEPIAGGDSRAANADDLLVIKTFGEPMYAALKPVGTLDRSEDRPYHALVSAENFHALQLLLYLYEGQVDCIYIDPPYNTGNSSWKYNNNFVEKEDSYRHSKWLSMMEKRLRLAQRLLRPDGVLIVMIDEYELHHLGLLLELIFKGMNRYMVSIVTNSRGSTGASGNFGVIEEQALFIVPNVGHDLIEPREAFIPHLRGAEQQTDPATGLIAELSATIDDVPAFFAELGIELSDAQRMMFEAQRVLFDIDEAAGQDADEAATSDGSYWTSAQRTGQGTSFRTQRKNQFYPIYVDEKTHLAVRAGQALMPESKGDPLPEPSFERVDGLLPVWPIDRDGAERAWCFEHQRMNREIGLGNLRVGRFNTQRNSYSLSIRRVRASEARFRERTIWWHPSYDAGANGTTMLTKLLGKSGLFNFPKSVYAVRDTLASVVGSRPDALILDFFAGSATTMHATMLLNALDGGHRRCVAVTNNEVDAVTAAALEARGIFPGDAEYESAGIFEQVAVPRIKAAVTGLGSNGKPLTGKYKWAAGRNFKDGFDENVEFFRLEYLDPDEVDLGRQLDAILPALWLASGSVGSRESVDTRVGWSIPKDSQYGILLRESRFRPFAAALAQRPDVTHVWIVTDSANAFADMVDALPAHLRASMLYRDYLRNFQINVERSR